MLFIISGSKFDLDRAVFVQWIISQSVLSERNFEALMKDCYESEKTIYDDIKDYISEKPLKLYLAVDTFILIGLSGENREALYEISGDICGILMISQKDVFDYIKMSKSILCQSIMRLPKRNMKLLVRDFSFYITDDTYEAKLLNKSRTFVLKWNKAEISYCVKNGIYVKQGQKIAHKNCYYGSKNCRASEDGYLYHFINSEKRYFIISPKGGTFKMA